MYSPLVNKHAANFLVTPQRQQADAIIVLTGGAYNDGSLLHCSIMRTLYGTELYKEGLAKEIVFSGGNMLRCRVDVVISQKMLELALKMGMPKEALIAEEKSLRTYQNAVETK